MKKKTLFLLLALAALIYAIWHLAPEAPGPYFSAQLVEIDTGRATALFLSPQYAPEKEVLLKREGKTWIAVQGNRSVKASAEAVAAVLSVTASIKTHHVVGRGPQVWAQCGLDAGQGLRVRVLEGANTLDDFFIGTQTAEDGVPMTYIRLAKDDEVFAVPGNLVEALNPGFDTFRSKVFLELDAVRLTGIRLELYEAGSQGEFYPPVADSYLADIRSLQGEVFADNFDPQRDASLLAGRITFFATEWDAPIEAEWYCDTLREKPFLFHSSLNPHNYFASDSAGLYGKLVAPLLLE